MSEDEGGGNADELRRVLRAVGRGDHDVREVFDTQLRVVDANGNVVAYPFQHEPHEWAAFGRAKWSGGWGVHIHGDSIEAAFRALLALGDDVLAPAVDTLVELPGVVARALESVAREGRREVLSDGVVLRWMTVFADDDWKRTHRAYRIALEVASKTLGAPRRNETVKRRGGPSLKCAAWETVALFESDHDPGAGALVQLAEWERGKPTVLPPWG